jgi:hypothetical protein
MDGADGPMVCRMVWCPGQRNQPHARLKAERRPGAAAAQPSRRRGELGGTAMTTFPKWRTGLLIVAVVALVPAGLAAASGKPIKPNQHFIGFVNGKSHDAVVYTVCPGPLGPGELGPPAGNQPVKVVHVRSGGGDTGSTGNLVYSFIPGGPPAITTLTHYNTPGDIPMSGRVPCDGTGVDIFTSCAIPAPCGTGAKTYQVDVTFEDIAT